MRHKLKIKPSYFAALKRGEKTCEIRLNDRDYRVGDVLDFTPIRDDGTYTGEVATYGVSHVLKDFEGLAEGYVALSLR